MIDSWYRVTFDRAGLARDVSPPGGEPWQDRLAWDAIVRVCLDMGDFPDPDTLYLFSRDRPQSDAIPLPRNCLFRRVNLQLRHVGQHSLPEQSDPLDVVALRQLKGHVLGAGGGVLL